jgi:hypothetical protein
MDPNAKNQNQDNPTQDQDTNKTAMEGILTTVQELKTVNESLLASNKELTERLAAQDKAQADLLEKQKADKLDDDADITKLLADLDGGDTTNRADKKVDLDSLSNKELVDLVASAMDTTIGANMKKIEKLLEERQGVVDKKVTETQQALGQLIVKQGIEDLAAKHPDFNELKPEIAKNLEKYPGIDIAVAYKLAKADRLEKEPAPEQVFSERPGEELSVQGLPLVKRPDRTVDSPANAGLTGFRNAFDAAYDRIHQ